MNIRRKTALYSLGSTVAQVSILVRGVVVARIVGPENMGIAAMFIAIAGFGELVAATGADRFLVQDRDGAEPRAASTMHLVGLVRGVALSACLAALSLPLARAFDAEAAWGGYLVIAFLPLLSGFQSLDSVVQQREMRVRGRLVVDVAAQVLALVVGVAAAFAWGDWRAVVAALVAQSAGLVVSSHLVSERPWGLAWDPVLARRAFWFSAPLIASSLCLFLSLHGDRIAIALADGVAGAPTYDLADLGRYLVAGGMAILPVRTAANVARNVFMPWLAASSEPLESGRRRRDMLLAFATVTALFLAVGVTCGGALLEIVFGKSYGDLQSLFALLALAQGLRVIRVTSNAAAMARGDSVNTFYGGVSRLLGVALAVACAFLGLPLLALAGCAVVGELVALLAAEIALRRKHGLHAGPKAAFALALAMLFLASGLSWWSFAVAGPWIGLCLSLAVQGVALGALLAVSPPVRREFSTVVSLLRRRGRGASAPQAAE